MAAEGWFKSDELVAKNGSGAHCFVRVTKNFRAFAYDVGEGPRFAVARLGQAERPEEEGSAISLIEAKRAANAILRRLERNEAERLYGVS